MSDRCEYCRVRGDIEKCEATPCGNRESWYVRELQKKLAEAEAKIPRWIPVGERLPDPEENPVVLMIDSCEDVYSCPAQDARWLVSGCTHWMPLPNPPEEE